MSTDLSWRMVRERLDRGEATGILCGAEERRAWMARLDDVPLLQVVDGDTLYSASGALIRFCETAREAQDWDARQPRSVVWIDDANLLEAPLPAPKPSNEE